MTSVPEEMRKEVGRREVPHADLGSCPPQAPCATSRGHRGGGVREALAVLQPCPGRGHGGRLEGGEEGQEEALAQQEQAGGLLPGDPFPCCCSLGPPSAAEVDDDHVVLRT